MIQPFGTSINTFTKPFARCITPAQHNNTRTGHQRPNPKAVTGIARRGLRRLGGAETHGAFTNPGVGDDIVDGQGKAGRLTGAGAALALADDGNGVAYK